MARAHPFISVAAVTATLVTAAGCATSAANHATAGGTTGGRVVQVVAAENFWGGIAAQVGGAHVHVTSIITNPDTDPHSYEPTASDARDVAEAQYAIVNGVGYDPWASKLINANPSSSRTVLNVGDTVGVAQGGNPHRWYSPDDVHRVIGQITSDLQKLDPADAPYFAQQRTTFETQTLGPYTTLINTIKAKYAGAPIGASESIVTPLAEGLGLDLVTPESFLDAISEGNDPTAKDKSAIDTQIAQHQIKVYVYNSQNSTPDVQEQVDAAKAQGIPVTTVTETLAPAGATFQDWQTAQLQRLSDALAQATAQGTGR